jgi:hypothetical protein
MGAGRKRRPAPMRSHAGGLTRALSSGQKVNNFLPVYVGMASIR